MQIHPALLTNDFNEMLLLVASLEPALPHYDIDVINWSRTHSTTVDPLQALTIKTHCQLTFDLMLDFPTATVRELVKDPRVDTIIINLESKEPIEPLFDLIHFYKKKAGISVNPDNHFYQIVPYFTQIEMIEIFTIEPGAQGNPFLPERLELTKHIRDFGFSCEIEIDGGVNRNTIDTVKKFPIDICSVGSFIQRSADPLASYREISMLLNS